MITLDKPYAHGVCFMLMLQCEQQCVPMHDYIDAAALSQESMTLMYS